jgi:hypothetical protein
VNAALVVGGGGDGGGDDGGGVGHEGSAATPLQILMEHKIAMELGTIPHNRLDLRLLHASASSVANAT